MVEGEMGRGSWGRGQVRGGGNIGGEIGGGERYLGEGISEGRRRRGP